MDANLLTLEILYWAQGSAPGEANRTSCVLNCSVAKANEPKVEEMRTKDFLEYVEAKRNGLKTTAA
jgi:hypothetical protein